MLANLFAWYLILAIDPKLFDSFPPFHIGTEILQYVPSFRYLKHIITRNNSDDDNILGEINNMLVRTNILIRKFFKCAAAAKLFCLRHTVCVYMMPRCGSIMTSVL